MDIADPASLRRLVRWVVALAMAWSVLVLAAMAVWGGDELWRLLASIGLPLAAATAVLFAVNHALRFLRWDLMLRAEGHRLPWRRSLSVFLAGLALLPTPAKVGVAARSVLLLPEGVPAHVSLAAYYTERLTDFIGLVILASVLWIAAGDAQRWILALAIGIAGVTLVRAGPAICRMAGTRASGKALRMLDWIARLFADAADMLAGWRLPAFIAIGMAANVVTGLLLWLALGGAVEPSTVAGVLAVSHLSGSISMLPGGLGGFELAMLAQLAALQVPAGQALAALAVVRVATLWGSVAVGLPLLWLGLRRTGVSASKAAPIRADET